MNLNKNKTNLLLAALVAIPLLLAGNTVHASGGSISLGGFVDAPDPQISITDDLDPALLSETVTFTVKIENKGTKDAFDLGWRVHFPDTSGDPDVFDIVEFPSLSPVISGDVEFAPYEDCAFYSYDNVYNCRYEFVRLGAGASVTFTFETIAAAVGEWSTTAVLYTPAVVTDWGETIEPSVTHDSSTEETTVCSGCVVRTNLITTLN